MQPPTDRSRLARVGAGAVLLVAGLFLVRTLTSGPSQISGNGLFPLLPAFVAALFLGAATITAEVAAVWRRWLAGRSGAASWALAAAAALVGGACLIALMFSYARWAGAVDGPQSGWPQYTVGFFVSNPWFWGMFLAFGLTAASVERRS